MGDKYAKKSALEAKWKSDYPKKPGISYIGSAYQWNHIDDQFYTKP